MCVFLLYFSSLISPSCLHWDLFPTLSALWINLVASIRNLILHLHSRKEVRFPRSERSLLKSQTGNRGETTSSVTKDTREYLKKVFNIDSTSTTYGRKIDVMVATNESKLPLCAIELSIRGQNVATPTASQKYKSQQVLPGPYLKNGPKRRRMKALQILSKMQLEMT